MNELNRLCSDRDAALDRVARLEEAGASAATIHDERVKIAQLVEDIANFGRDRA